MAIAARPRTNAVMLDTLLERADTSLAPRTLLLGHLTGEVRINGYVRMSVSSLNLLLQKITYRRRSGPW